MNVIQKINMNYDTLTTTEQKIAQYVKDNPKSIELYTIVKIATLTATSKSAVLRFCQKLGYQGYKEFRYDLINFLHQDGNKITTVDDITKIISSFSKALNFMTSVDKHVIEKLINDIYLSNDIYILGMYKSAVLAQKLKYNLIDCGKSSHYLCDLISLNHTAYLLKQNSLLLIFSISGDSKEIIAFLNETKHLNYNTYLVTCKNKSNIGKAVKNTIVLPSINLEKQIKIDEHAIIMVFIEILSYLYLSKHLNELK